jgi:Pyruvate/2-oxoacid:ferredoxin oxidoreductase delta subunit
MDFSSFVDGPLLWFVFLAFIIGLTTRLAFFLGATIRSSLDENSRGVYILTSIARTVLPFHKAVTRKPVYISLRYIFHTCLIVVPIWMNGHVVLWEESRFEWSWASLPDAWIDFMTLLLLGIAAYFLIRRLINPKTRLNSSKSDYFLIFIAALPFTTGYFLAHGNLDAMPFFRDNIFTLHVLSGEGMLLSVIFLFYRTDLDGEKCTGCASCVIACPTETLMSKDNGKFRIFSYQHYQCVCCGACVNACPEEAAALRHEISHRKFFRIFSRQEIKTIELSECRKCGARFAPEPQLKKIRQKITDDFIHSCPRCRVNNYVEITKLQVLKTISRKG